MKMLNRDGSEVKEGDVLTDFRGDVGTFISVTRWRTDGKSCKVCVKVDSGRGDGRTMIVEQYHGVWGLTPVFE